MTQDRNISETEIVKITDPQNSSRRRAVKTIAGGVGALAAYHVLPVNWTTPIVEQVFLPAHAAVSGITLSNPCNVELVSGNQASSIDVIRVSGFVTPPVGGLDVAIAALPNGGTGGQVDVFTTTNADGTYSAEVTMVGGPGIIGVGVGTATAGVGNISGCAIGLPPAETPQPPATTTPQPTTVAITSIPSCGDPLTPNSTGGASFSVDATVLPNPGAGEQLTLEVRRNGSLIITAVSTTDANGTVGRGVNLNTVNTGDEIISRWIYAGTSSVDCIHNIL